MRDVSEQHAAKAALKALLLSTSFDLRISAQNVNSASELLLSLRSIQSDQEAAYLASAVKSGCNSLLFGVTSNVLELRKLERGEYSLFLQPFSISAVVRDVLQVCRMSAQGSPSVAMLGLGDETDAQELPECVEVSLRHGCCRPAGQEEAPLLRRCQLLTQAPFPRLSQGDVSKIRFILHNMVHNAIKFSGAALVTIHVALSEETAAGKRMLVVDVTDRGPGLTAEQQESIFQPFTHVVSEAAGGQRGVGIGLHLSRSFARAMGGDVSVHSTPGQGATFTMSVPVRVLTAEEAARIAQLSISDNGSRVQAPQPELDRPMSFRIAPPGTAAIPPLADGLAASIVAGDAAAQEVLVTHMMSSLLEHAPDGFMCCTSGKPPVITFTSKGLTRMLGWTPEMLRGQSLYALIPPDDVRSPAAVLQPLLEGCGPASSVSLMRRVRCAAADKFRWMHVNITRPVEPVDGFIYSVWRDATAFQDSQAALQEFLITTSHDMRTPVHSILTAAQLLAARPSVVGDADASFLCRTICDAATLMLQVITNVMSFMRNDAVEEQDAAAASPKRASFDAQSLLDAALQACDAGLTVRLEPDPNAPVPPHVEGDAAKMTLILSNCVHWLLRRGARLTARVRFRAGDAGGAATLELDLQQPELHLSEEECESIFSPFYPAESEGDTFTQSGLGMHAARTFARGMGGNLTAFCGESHSEGTVLRLSAPVHVPPSAAPAVLQKRTATEALSPRTPPPGERQLRPRALIVEDHQLNAQLVARLLSRSGFEVSIANDGVQGLAILMAALHDDAAAHPLPDLILADLHMPNMGGAEMVRLFRQAEAIAKPGRRLLILALSANVCDANVAECMQAGMDGHISKPLRADLIPVLLERIREGSGA